MGDLSRRGRNFGRGGPLVAVKRQLLADLGGQSDPSNRAGLVLVGHRLRNRNNVGELPRNDLIFHLATTDHGFRDSVVVGVGDHFVSIQFPATVNQPRHSHHGAAALPDQSKPAAVGSRPGAHFPVFPAFKNMIDPEFGDDQAP